MGAAAFYDLDGTLVRTNLVHAFAFSARNQQGILKSALKTAATLISVPMFMAADFYNRRLFNDLFFVRYKGESEDRLRCLAQELFDTVLRPSIIPGAYELIDKSRQLGLRQVLVTGALDITVGPLAKHLKIDRAPAAPRDGRRDQGQLDAHLRRKGKPELVGLLRLQRQHERPADAVGRRAPHGGEPGHPAARDGAAARLADIGSTMTCGRLWDLG